VRTEKRSTFDKVERTEKQRAEGSREEICHEGKEESLEKDHQVFGTQ
jgi:hypothetical protein